MDDFDVILSGKLSVIDAQNMQFETLTVDLEMYRWTVS